MQHKQIKKQHKKPTAAAKKAPIRRAKRTMTSFAGPKAGNSQVFATGVLNRKQNGKDVATPIAVEFNAAAQFNTLSTSHHRFVPGSALVDTYTEALLLNDKGDAAKVAPMTIEPVVKDAKAAFTGPAFAWTKAQVNSTSVDGATIDTTYDFGANKIGFKLVKKAKDAAESFEESGELDIVERSQFYDFVRVQKTSHEKLALEQAAI